MMDWEPEAVWRAGLSSPSLSISMEVMDDKGDDACLGIEYVRKNNIPVSVERNVKGVTGPLMSDDTWVMIVMGWRKTFEKGRRRIVGD
jgi:hypothetical protein